MTSQDLYTLEPEEAPDGSVYNIFEDGSIKYGPLRRYLKLMAPILDEAKGLIDIFPTMIDVDETDEQFLAPMGRLVDVTFNRDITITQARNEIKLAVPWYKRKGTTGGTALKDFSITNEPMTTVEYWRHVLTSARVLPMYPQFYNVSVDLDDDFGMQHFELEDDIFGRSLDFKFKNQMEPGSASASSNTADNEAQLAVDEREDTYWEGSSDSGEYWEYVFDDPYLPRWLRMKSTLGVREFTLQYSDDGVNYEDVESYDTGCIETRAHFLGIADGTAQTFYARRHPLKQLPPPEVYEVTSENTIYTQLQEDACEGDTIITVTNIGEIAEGTWIKLTDEVFTDYYLVNAIRGVEVELIGGVLNPYGFPKLDTRVYVVDIERRWNVGRVEGTSFDGTSLNGLTLQYTTTLVPHTITFSGLPDPAEPIDVALAIMDAAPELRAEVLNGNLVLTTVDTGLGPFLDILGGTALGQLGISAATYLSDFSVDYWTGAINLQAGEFTDENAVVIQYNCVDPFDSLFDWKVYEIPQYLQQPHTHWRISIDSTWNGANARINEIQLFADEVYDRPYRPEMLGLFYDFARPPWDGVGNACDGTVSLDAFDKICRLADTIIPVGTMPVFGVFDCHYEERVQITEQYHDEISTL